MIDMNDDRSNLLRSILQYPKCKKEGNGVRPAADGSNHGPTAWNLARTEKRLTHLSDDVVPLHRNRGAQCIPTHGTLCAGIHQRMIETRPPCRVNRTEEMVMPLILTTPPASDPPDIFTVLIVVLLVVGAAFLLVWQTRARIQRRRDDAGTPRERLEAIKSRAEADDSRHAAMSEMEDAARRLAAILDNKAERLDILIEQADQRIHQLQAIQAAVRSDSDSVSDAPKHEPPDPRAARIHALADQGLPIVDIARKLDEQIGTVELVLALRRSRGQS